MAKKFMDEDFLLETDSGKILYHQYAESMPIYDYHCHIPVKDIKDNKRFENITQVWLYGDHYKWRAMRACGVNERLITGDAGDYEKFKAWAEVVPQTIGNPLYHWTHLELKRYFGVEKLLCPETAREIYDKCSGMVDSDDFRVRSIIRRSNVKVLCTTDSPLDSLEYHRALKEEPSWGTSVLPAFRPDPVLAVDDKVGFNAWIDELEKIVGKNIYSFESLVEALWERHRFFSSMGCRLSDYGLEVPHSAPFTAREAEDAFRKARSGDTCTDEQVMVFKSALLSELMKMHCRQDWTQQFHFCALRNNNSKGYASLGRDTGYDCIGDFSIGASLVRLLDNLDKEDSLTRTIIYSVNPVHNELIASIIGSFMDGKTPGKIQMGSAWWFNDQKDGMERQMTALANVGLLSRFVGMLTDSRSFLSYPRHEYFRRILCNMLGRDMDRGLIPDDMELVGNMVRDICFNNAVNYFGMELPK